MPNPRKPDNIHLLQGTFQPCRHGDPDKKPKVDSRLPSAPEWLPDLARKEWDEVSVKLGKANLLTGVDKTILAQYCLLAAELSEEQYKFTAAKHTQLRLCEVELGMTPKARSQITLPDDNGEEF